MKTQRVTCRKCRASMRQWALEGRRLPHWRPLCIGMAKAFRDGPCLHDVFDVLGPISLTEDALQILEKSC